ncbi:MAG: hypothetical protein AAGE94_12270 [Acidobacteriota bacterium]
MSTKTMPRSAWLVAAPPLALAGLVATTGVDLAYWDQWALVPHLEALADGRLRLADLWTQHNEHRLLVPQLVMVALAWLTDWNVHAELAMNLVLALGLLGVLTILVRKTIETPPTWLLPLLSLLLFSPGQWENWAWGWQIQIFANVLAVAATLTLLVDADRPTRFAAALVCAVIATFSFANGLLIWGLGLPLVARDGRARWPRTILWILAALAVAALYFHGLGVTDRPSFFDDGVPRTLKLFGGYLAIYLGAPLLGFHGHVAMYGGFLLLVAVAVFGLVETRREGLGWLLGPRLPWLLLAGYAVASALLTAYGRLYLGLGQALTSRYVTLSTCLWIGVAGLLALAGQRPWIRRLALAALVPLAIQWGVGAERLHTIGEERRAIRAAIVDGRPVDLGTIYPDPEVVEERLATLRRLGLGPFRDAPYSDATPP